MKFWREKIICDDGITGLMKILAYIRIWRLAPLKNIFWDVRKDSAAFGGRIIFFKTLILLILLRKINKISVLKNILWRRKPPKNIWTDVEVFLQNLNA